MWKLLIICTTMFSMKTKINIKNENCIGSWGDILSVVGKPYKKSTQGIQYMYVHMHVVYTL